ncbi:glycerophosphodiester phosphodiesterase [Candidatus Harpocratesius sp.]
MKNHFSNSFCNPIIFAHRGASGYAHENSFEAFDKAVELGAHGVEFDCWLTKDKHVIIHHDRFFFNQATNRHINLNRLSISEIKKLILPNGQHIPTLEEFCQRYQDVKIHEPINGYSKLLFSIDLQDNRVGFYIIPILAHYNLLDRTFLCSNTLWKIRDLKLQFPKYSLHFIASNLEYHILQHHLEPNGKIRKLKIDGFNIQAPRFKEEYKLLLKSAGLRIFLWDMHTNTILKKFLKFNPDAIYTNFPDKACQVRDKYNCKVK